MSDFKFFNKHERKILHHLYGIRKECSTSEIAQDLEMHWTTVEKSLKKLVGKRWVIKRELSNKVLWRFNFIHYEKEKIRDKIKEMRKNR